MKKILFLILFLTFSTTASARIYIPIDQPSDKKFPIAICDLVHIEPFFDSKKIYRQIADIIRNDLKISGYFEIIPKEAFLENQESSGITKDTVDFTQWTAIEALALIKGGVKKDGKELLVELRLFDPYLGQMLVGKEYKGTSDDIRMIAHRFSDEVMEALTSIRGIFNTKITYTAASKRGNKEIYVMDMDGYNNYRISDTKSINLGSSWSPDGKYIVYTSYAKGTPDLYLIDAKYKNTRRITNNSATNITPAWHPNGKYIAYASSETGYSNIRIIDTKGSLIKQLTTSYAIDIGPDFSPDGSHIVFASERAGNLHLFRIPIEGGESKLKRLTYVGHYNDTPAWSPDGLKIVFASQDRGNFDIFIMNSDGSYIQRLTAEVGNNEHPAWSPDGRFITFSSTRDGKGKAIFIMRADGSNQARISDGNGSLPDWGAYIR